MALRRLQIAVDGVGCTVTTMMHRYVSRRKTWAMIHAPNLCLETLLTMQTAISYNENLTTRLRVRALSYSGYTTVKV